MAGHGISVSSGNYGSYNVEEHGYIIGIMSVMPKTAYQQGIPKTYLKNDPLDYFWPSLLILANNLFKFRNYMHILPMPKILLDTLLVMPNTNTILLVLQVILELH